MEHHMYYKRRLAMNKDSTIAEVKLGETQSSQLQIQRRAENHGIWSFKHLRRFLELFLQFFIADNFGCLCHLTDEFLQTSENSDETAFELVRQLANIGE